MTGQVEFPPLGLGITGPHAGLAVSRHHTRALIREAVDLGVTYFDTGPAYGNGEAEKRLGLALRPAERGRVFISTKAGIHPHRRRDFSAGAVEMSLKGSLQRLNTDYIDLLFLHGPGPADLTPRLLRRLRALRDLGLIRRIGICGRGDELKLALDDDLFDTVMAPFSPLIADADLQRLEHLKSAGKTVVGIEIMTGAQRSLSFPPGLSDLWYAARSLKRRLNNQNSDAHALTPPQCLERALASPLLDSVMTLTTRPRHLHANAMAAGLEAEAPIP